MAAAVAFSLWAGKLFQMLQSISGCVCENAQDGMLYPLSKLLR